jgi:glycine/D-amino acid oxidase-like deaminating enzyme
VSTDLASTSDVVILGAGFAGCATAWALARRGIEALVLEREPELGRYASGRGAGLGRQLCEDDDTSTLAMRGAALTRAYFPQAWHATGGILCFDTTPHAAEYVARAQRLSLAHAVLDRAQVLAQWPQLTDLPIASAIHLPTDGVIDAMTLLRGLAQDRRIELSTHATKLLAKPGAVEVRVESRAIATKVIEARVVVDATGAWAGAITGDAPLESFKRHLFVLEAAPSGAAPYVWHVGDRELYLRADGDSLLVSPCDADVTTAQDQQPSANADARLRARLQVAPQLAKAPIVKRWACQRAFTPDRRMRLGRDPQRPWLVWAAGLGGHGATAAPAVGEVVADAVVQALS